MMKALLSDEERLVADGILEALVNNFSWCYIEHAYHAPRQVLERLASLRRKERRINHE